VNNLLFDYYFALCEVLVLLVLLGGVGVAVYWGLRRRWRNRLEALEQKHADDLAKHDSEYFQKLHSHLQSAVAHEFAKGLNNISTDSKETLERLGDEHEALRQKQKRIIARAYELEQHAENILALFVPEGQKPQDEFLNLRGLVEGVLIDLFPYAESKDVTLLVNLDALEPTPLDRNLTLLSLKNVFHNATKYSFPGGVVEVDLSFERGEEGAGKTIYLEVKDTGKGIPEKDQEKIFELRTRGDGLVEPGSGLGLYLARKAARRQDGDVILVRSSLNQGSVFKIILPYTGMIDFNA
jgi:signal transduction histidine kinase